MIIKVFLWGAWMTLPALFVQLGLSHLLGKMNVGAVAWNLIYWFIIIAFSEEFFKFLAVRAKVFQSQHLDEPLDIMLYMVVAALGFAAVENVLYLFPVDQAGYITTQMSFNDLMFRASFLTLIRFLGATFLHTLCSAVVGYFLAFSFYYPKRRIMYTVLGLLTATGLHGLYNFSIIVLQGYIKAIIPIIIIFALGFIVSLGFDKLKKMKGICKIN